MAARASGPAPDGGGWIEEGRAVGERGGGAARRAARPRFEPEPGAEPTPAAAPAASGPLVRYARFEDVVALIRERRDVPLLVEVETGLRLVRYAPGRIEFTPAQGAAADLAQRLAAGLGRWTGARWGVSVVSEGGAPTIAEDRAAARRALEAEALEHPLVQAVMARFPHARITEIRAPGSDDAEPAIPPDPDLAEPDPAEGWDPFEDG